MLKMNKIDILNCCRSLQVFSVQLCDGLGSITIKHTCCQGVVLQTLSSNTRQTEEAELSKFKASLE